MTTYNFSPGPAILPTFVKDNLKLALENFNNCGIGIAELSHRSTIFSELVFKTEEKILDICNLHSNDYKVLFLQGGANQQFAMIPMNFLAKDKKAAYVISGVWAKKALQNAKFYGDAINVAESENLAKIPSLNDDIISNKNYSYLHLTSNNTIYGTSLTTIPTCNSPIICDASSDFLSRKMDFSKADLWYACAQKNLGVAGLTLVIIKKSLLEKENKTPDIFSYKVHAEKNSCFNTPSTIGILATSLTIDWINNSGGLKVIEKENIKKANLIYSALDKNDTFIPFSDKSNRSNMNITFNLCDDSLKEKFEAGLKENNFLFVNGHRSVGGYRISNYNAQSFKACEAISNYMNDFSKTNN